MALVKFRTRDTFMNPFENILNDFFEGEFLPMRRNVNFGSIPAANIQETESSFLVELAAPGMTKEDFKIELDENLLTIRSENETEKEEKDGKFTKREFNYSSFVRSFRLPEEVDAEKISASYAEGILKLEIPKVEIEVKKIRQIDVK